MFILDGGSRRLGFAQLSVLFIISTQLILQQRSLSLLYISGCPLFSPARRLHFQPPLNTDSLQEHTAWPDGPQTPGSPPPWAFVVWRTAEADAEGHSR